MTNFNEIPEGSVEYNAVEYPYERNGFVTFWLWLGIIGSIITLLLNLINPSLFQPTDVQWLFRQSSSLMLPKDMIDSLSTIFTVIQWTSVICAIGACVGYMKLLSWRKSGFYIVVAANLIECVITILCYSLNPYIGQLNYEILLGIPLVRCGILWIILQISKDGYSCWQQLY